jgi:hypothetical protein
MAAAAASRPRGPAAAIVAPATAAPADPAATLSPAIETNTCARASGGA